MELPVYTYPQCDDAHMILNRAALTMLRHPDCIVSSSALRMRESALLLFGRSLLSSEFPNYYVQLDGRFEYVFILVRCGHCAKCRHAKLIDLCNRVNMESACYNCPCYMITLTYDNEHLPANRIVTLHGVNTLYYKDIQNFFKRLRIRWSRAGIPHNIRYLVAGEYGKLHHRPHWHILLWNNPYCCSNFDSAFVESRNVLLHHKFVRDVFESWSMCSADCFQCEPAGDGAAAYVSKYLQKQSNVSLRDGRRSPFIRTSIKHGGIGSPLVERYRDYYCSNPHLHMFTYRSFSGSVVQCPITSFISQKLYKSASRQVSYKYKRLYSSLVDICQHLIDCDLLSPSYARNICDSYSLHVLYYKLDVRPSHIPIPSLDFIDVRQRLLYCLDSTVELLDEQMSHEHIDSSLHMLHKLSIVPSDDNRGSLAYDAFKASCKFSELLSKERL